MQWMVETKKNCGADITESESKVHVEAPEPQRFVRFVSPCTPMISRTIED